MFTTPYQTVYDRFLGRISDYTFANMLDDTLTTTLHNYMISAIVKFKQCRQDLTQRDDVAEVFNLTLTDEEIEILAVNMVVEWFTSKELDDKLLKATMTDKDFQIYSQANMLSVLMRARKDLKIESKQLIRAYTYDAPQGQGIDQLSNKGSDANTKGIVLPSPDTVEDWEGY